MGTAWKAEVVEMKIVATSDGSTRSETVIPHAHCLASAVDGELILLRVLSPVLDCGSVRGVSLAEAVPIVAEQMAEELEATLRRLGIAGSRHVEIRQHTEPIEQSILRFLAAHSAKVLAISTRGHGLTHHMFGSTALSVLGQAPLPVLTAGKRIAGPPAGAVYRVLVTSDGSSDAIRAVEACASLFGNQESAEVALLRVHVPPADAQRDWRERDEHDLQLLRNRFPQPDRVTVAQRSVETPTEVAGAILATAAELGAHSISMSTHGHSASYHVFLGSTAMAVLSEAVVPVLLVRSAPPS